MRLIHGFEVFKHRPYLIVVCLDEALLRVLAAMWLGVFKQALLRCYFARGN